MKEVIRYKCDYCRKLFATVKGATNHEKGCLHNPTAKHCFYCEFAHYGWLLSNEGNETNSKGCRCYYTEDNCSKGDAESCSTYCRSEKLYFDREYTDAKENYKKLIGSKETADENKS